jgi:two-component system nitrate/nitrite response regulator NarL
VRVSALRVLIADDHPVFRDGVAAALRRQDDIEVVAECRSADEAAERIHALDPDVAILDNRMPGTPTREVIAQLVGAGVRTRVLVLSAHDDAENVGAALEAGASGYLTKDSDRSVICESVRRVARGETVIASEVQGALAERLRSAAVRPRALLTEREQQVLRFLAEGKSAPAIAEELVLSATTVKTHLGNLYEKLGVSDRAAAVAEAMRRGLID